MLVLYPKSGGAVFSFLVKNCSFLSHKGSGCPFWTVTVIADETHIEIIWIIFMPGDGP